MRTSLLVLLLAATLAGCHAGPRRPHSPSPSPLPSPAPASMPMSNVTAVKPAMPSNGYDEDADCGYVFSQDDARRFASVLSEITVSPGCQFDGVQVQYTRAVAVWKSGAQKVQMAFESGMCGEPAKSPQVPLMAVDADPVKNACGPTYEAAIRAMNEGRLPVPQRRPHAVARVQ